MDTVDTIFHKASLYARVGKSLWTTLSIMSTSPDPLVVQLKHRVGSGQADLSNHQCLSKCSTATHSQNVKKESRQKLPKSLPAAVCAQHVRCGKSGCKCSRGLLHGPYFYCFWREGGKLKKAYVRLNDVESVRSICQGQSLHQRMLKREFDLWRNLQHELKEVEQYVQT